MYERDTRFSSSHYVVCYSWSKRKLEVTKAHRSQSQGASKSKGGPY
jgi:hypothetical protein